MLTRILWFAGKLEPYPMPKGQRTFTEYIEIQGAAESVLCIPQSSKEEAIDAFMQPSFLFQATVSPKHPIQRAGLVAASKVRGACIIYLAYLVVLKLTCPMFQNP